MIRIIILLLTLWVISFSQASHNYYGTELFINSNPFSNFSQVFITPSLSSTFSYTLPDSQGSSGNYLASSSNGNLFWISANGGASVGEPNRSVQFFDNGILGSSSFLWDNSLQRLAINSSNLDYALNVNSETRVGSDGQDGELIIESDSGNQFILNLDNGLLSSTTYFLPPDDGEKFEALQTDGNGNLVWGGQVSFGPTSNDEPSNDNDISGGSDDAYIGGGNRNDIEGDSDQSSIFGGDENTVDDSSNSSITGGDLNIIEDGTDNAYIGAGVENQVDANSDFSVIFSGQENEIDDDDDGSGARYSIIGGGLENEINEGDEYNVVLGGRKNELNNAVNYTTVLGGRNFDFESTQYSSALVGYDDDDDNTNLDGDYSVIAGSVDRVRLRDNYQFLGNGEGIDIDGEFSFVMNGDNNDIEDGDSDHSGILYGENNLITGPNSFVGGNSAQTENAYAIAIGNNVTANNDGSIVFADSDPDDEEVESTEDNQWVMRFNNGYKLYSDESGTVGVQALNNASAWSSISDSTKKEHIISLNEAVIYNRIKGLKIFSWNYIGNKKTKRAIGPMFQQFDRLFGKDSVGVFNTSKSIKVLDLSSLFLAGVKENAKKVKTLEEKVKLQKISNKELFRKLDDIEKRIKILEKQSP